MSENTSTKQENVKNEKYSLDGYFTKLAETNDKLVEGVLKAKERNNRLFDQFVETMVAGQKDLIELSRAVASAPTDYKSNTKLTLDTLKRRQACALEFGQALYKEQSELNAEVSSKVEEMFQPLKNTNVDWTAPYRKMTEFWAPGTKQ